MSTGAGGPPLGLPGPAVVNPRLTNPMTSTYG